jgi:hypothetical protein
MYYIVAETINGWLRKLLYRGSFEECMAYIRKKRFKKTLDIYEGMVKPISYEDV